MMLRPTGVDLFAGFGGSTTGAKRAGVNILLAANHSPLAVDFHTLNHPEVEHRCQDLRQADFSSFPDCDLALASSSCKGHTRARGRDKPHHDAERSTAWAVVDFLEAKKPHAGVCENVREMLDWILYPAWKDAIQRLGYSVSENILDAADFGIPQHRERLLAIFTRTRTPFALAMPKRAHVPASRIIDLNSGKWSQITKPGRSLKTLQRIKTGRARFGETFLIPYYSNGSGLTGRSLDRPIGTVTTKDRWAVIRGDEMRMVSIPEYRKAMDFGDDVKLPARKDKALALLGDAVPPGMMQGVISELIRAA